MSSFLRNLGLVSLVRIGHPGIELSKVHKDRVLKMEVFLLVTIPRKKNFNRLKLVVKPLSKAILPAELLPNTLGAMFWPFGLNLLKPIPHRGSIRRQDITLQSNIPKEFHRWGCTSSDYPRAEFLERIGYRWQVRLKQDSFSTKSQIRDECDGEDSLMNARTTSFQFGIGNLLERLPLEWDSLRVRLDELLVTHLEVSGTEFVLQWHECSNTIEVQVSNPDSSCIIDMRYLDPIPSNRPQDWAQHRMARVLADPGSSLETLSSMILDLHATIKQKFYILSNQVGDDEDELLDTETVSVATQLVAELIDLVIEVQRHVANPVLQTILQPECKSLLDALLHPSPADRIDLPTRESLIYGDFFYQFLGRWLREPNFVSDVQHPKSTHIIRQTRDRLMQDDLLESVRQIYVFLEAIRHQKAAADALLEKVHAIGSSIAPIQNSQISMPFSSQILKSLHQGVTEIIKGPLVAYLSGFGCQMLILGEDHKMQPISGIDSSQVVWAARLNSGRQLLHMKSQVDHLNQSIVEILATREQLWHTIPREYLAEYKKIEHDHITVLGDDSAWIFGRSNPEPGDGRKVLRVGWPHSLFAAAATSPRFALGSLPNTHRMSTIGLAAYDECLLMVEDARIQNPPSTLEFLQVGAIKVDQSGSLLSRVEPLINVTDAAILLEINNILPLRHREDLGICKTSIPSRLVSLFSLRSQQGADSKHPEQLIALSLLNWNIEKMQFQILNFASWRISTRVVHRHNSTFKIDRAEYFLCSTNRYNLLIKFDIRRMSLVSVGGGYVHKLPQELHRPLEMFGVVSNRPYWLFSRSNNLVTGNGAQLELYRLRYSLC